MVNKQYTVQHKKSNRDVKHQYSPTLCRASSIVSNTPNPENNPSLQLPNKQQNEDNIEKCLDHENCQRSRFGKNISLCSPDFLTGKHNSSVSDNQDIITKDISINDIGRFQYILQMDNEMGTHPDSLHRIPSRINHCSRSSSFSIASNLGFWKAGSEYPITHTAHNHSKYFRAICTNIKSFSSQNKWIYIIIAGILILTFLLYLILSNGTYTTNEDNFDGFIMNFSNTNTINDNQLEDIEGTLSKERDKDVVYFNIPALDWPLNSSEIFEKQNNTLDKLSSTVNNMDIITTSTTVRNSPRNTQIVKISSFDSVELDELTPPLIVTNETVKQNENQSQLTKGSVKIIGFTSGHQNNFGIPIEEDERILRILTERLIKSDIIQTSTMQEDISSSSRTPVYPTLPTIQRSEHLNTIKINPIAIDSTNCESTSLPFCRGVLPYDLTSTKFKKKLSNLDLNHFQYLINSNCSIRTADFVCLALEPECRPAKMGAFQPCKRICKSILEPCASIIASSEILTMTFDCGIYPDSNDQNICEDPTRHSVCQSTEFECLDSTCIPNRWKCDNIKDCSSGEDEENCLLCTHEEFRCHSNDKCIPDKWRCDQSMDCPDGSDENCYDYDDEDYTSTDKLLIPRVYSFASIQSPNVSDNESYLTFADNEPSGDEFDNILNTQYLSEGAENVEVITKMNKTNDNDQILASSSIYLTTTKTTTISKVPKNLANFQDSKEIMMTSDSETAFKYSTVNHTENTTTQSSVQKKIEKICQPNELRCVNGKCISLSQICDKIIDCDDGTDEKECIYKD